MIFRDESNLKPAPLAHRFAASGLTFSWSRNDSYQVGHDEMNRHCLSSQILLSTHKSRVACEGIFLVKELSSSAAPLGRELSRPQQAAIHRSLLLYIAG